MVAIVFVDEFERTHPIISTELLSSVERHLREGDQPEAR
jgi:hypothetical protein